MNDNNDVDQRLAEIRRERAGPGAQESAMGRAATRWQRASRRLRRGDILLATTAVLIAGVVIAALAVLVVSAATGGDDEPASAAVAPRTPTAARQTPVPPTAAAAASATPPPPAAQVSFRQDCDAIAGTDYENEAERAFFQQNCLEPDGEAPEPPTEAPDGPAPAAPFVPPTATQAASAPTVAPPPPPGSDASVAIGVAVGSIVRGGTYVTDGGACSALRISSHWVVTCSARVAGCQGAVCNTTVSVCVLDDLSTVRPSDRC